MENYGIDPDIDVDITPQEYVAGHDPQMAKGLEVILKRLEEEPVVKPSFGDRPKPSVPPLILPPHE